MNKLFRAMLAALLISVSFGAGSMSVLAQEDGTKQTVQLTEQQKKELAALHKQMIEQHKTIISKYVEFGVIPKEKGEKISSHLDKKYEKLEKNGFVPHWDHKKHKEKYQHHE